MPKARQQQRLGPIFVSGSDTEHRLVLLVLVQRKSSICVKPRTQVSLSLIKYVHLPAPGPL